MKMISSFFTRYSRQPRLWLGVLLILGLLLRSWHVTQAPAILNRDEAALAYNALLLKETGKDEWGKYWPVALESFGDYKLVGYPALLVGSFTLLGYNDFAVKLPSILAGTMLILLSYLFARNVLKLRQKYALLIAGFICLQPVFFFYSRIAFEANVALSLVVGGLYLLLRPRLLSWKSDTVAVILFLLAVLTYNTPLLLLPFLILIVIWWRGWRQPKKWLLPAAGLSCVLLLGLWSLFSLAQHKSGITIFTDETVWKQSVDYRLQFHGVAQKILGNRVVFFGRIILVNFWNTVTPHFLVTNGGAHPWHQLPGFGHLGWTVYLLSLTGLGVALSQIKGWAKKQKSLALLVLFVLIAPLPAVVTVDAPHATRSLLLFWTLTLLAGVAAQWLEMYLQKRGFRLARWVAVGVIALTLIESTNYFWQYFNRYPHQSFELLHGGYEMAIQRLEHQPELQHVAVIDPDGYQYILTAWYAKLPATTYFSTVQKHLPDKIGFRYGYKVGKYRFIVSPSDRFPNEQTLLQWIPNQGWQLSRE